MQVKHDTMRNGAWQRYTIKNETTTLGNLVRSHLQMAHYASCAMRHPLERNELQICLQATPASGTAEASRLLQQACQDTQIELNQFEAALDKAEAEDQDCRASCSCASSFAEE